MYAVRRWSVRHARGLEIFYAGASLGKTELPIGTDVWTSNGSVEAVGGCAIDPAESPARSGAALLTLAGLALAVGLRRRARAQGSDLA